MIKRMRPSPRVLKIRMVSDISVINECSIIKQLTHASFRKNFLQGGDRPEDTAVISPVAEGGGSGVAIAPPVAEGGGSGGGGSETNHIHCNFILNITHSRLTL